MLIPFICQLVLIQMFHQQTACMVMKHLTASLMFLGSKATEMTNIASSHFILSTVLQPTCGKFHSSHRYSVIGQCYSWRFHSYTNIVVEQPQKTTSVLKVCNF